MKRITAGAVLLCAALATAGCAGSSGNGQATFICPGSDNASLLQWNDLDGQLSGSYTYAELAGSAGNAAVSSDSATLTGTRDGSAITLAINVLFGSQPVSGSVNGDTLTLNVPQSDGSVQAGTCRAGSLEKWNQLIGTLGARADSSNAAHAQQQAAASAAAADAKTQEDAQRALAAVLDFSLDDSLEDLAADVAEADSDLAQGKADAALGAMSDGYSCYNLSGTVAYDITGTLEYTVNSSFAYDLDGLLSDIEDGRKAIVSLNSYVGTLQADGLPELVGVEAAAAAAEAEIDDAIATANGYIDHLNANVDEAYAVANSIATGECAEYALGDPPAPMAHVTG
ncbi:MAG: hypothetical protein KQH57_18570 [Actinomycetales bacterium]|nr:hypothetical protein [Actinomycetales bacterium]